MVRAKTNLSDVNLFLAKGVQEVCEAVATVGAAAVEYAKATGTYHDVTGRLRRSNRYEVTETGDLVLENTAPYAAEVEARGKEVISSAALYAEALLKEEFKGQ